jgi:hypothetical protein
MAQDDTLREVITHAVSAILGGGLSQFLQHRVNRRKAANGYMMDVLGSLKEERDLLLEREAKWEQENSDLREGVLALQAQLVALGVEPCYTLEDHPWPGINEEEEQSA